MNEMSTNDSTLITSLYGSREQFTVIGLTGLTGSGCSYLADIMKNKDFYKDEQNIRCAEGIVIPEIKNEINSYLFANNEENKNNKTIGRLVFKRKYSICQNFIKENYKPYEVIKYTDVLWLYTFFKLYITTKSKEINFSEQIFKTKLFEILKDKFALSYQSLDESYRRKKRYESVTILEDTCLNSLDFKSLSEEIIAVMEELNPIKDMEELLDVRGEKAECISKWFFNEQSTFRIFIDNLNSKLEEKDYLCLLILYHKLSCTIRATGDPLIKSENIEDKSNGKFLFDVVKLINVLIKGKKYSNNSNDRRIVIDSIRNSMEALYLKERFTAFYLIAVHDNKYRDEHLKQRIKKALSKKKKEKDVSNEEIETVFERVKHLSEQEADNKNYECGKFFSPNISQCIADAEIHLINNVPLKNKIPEFYTLAEQWMKYASLILHPGLISPSAEERCMMVAYTAKFNSGCLSRQVGAVITNQYHSVRTIGWNDVPYGQIPCSLRNLKDLTNGTIPHQENIKYIYSKFELSGETSYDNKKYTFLDKIKEDYKNLEQASCNMKGLPFSYCFKTLENRYSGDKNQVFTRSLHAEENAMMQMVKYGGEPLINGIIYVTASPCELCSKKLYQIGVRKIVYIDPYPGHAKELIIECGVKRPELKPFQGAYGSTYFKLYQPFMPYKDELEIRTKCNDSKTHTTNVHQLHSDKELLKKIMEKIGMENKATYTEDEFNTFKEKLNALKSDETTV